MTRCGKCARPIQWAKTTNGKPVPLDPDPVEGGNIAITRDLLGELVATVVDSGKGTHQVHFVICEYAETYRKPNL